MALTQAEVNAALGGQPGLNWTVTGAEPQSWRTGSSIYGSYLSVGRYSDTSGFNYELKTTLTGPGVLELSRSSDYQISTYIFLDGVQDGNGSPQIHRMDMRDRVVVPPGIHTVSWKSSWPNVPASTSFSNAQWLPGQVNLPVQLGANGSVITLSGPWTGQDIWHHGDGGAAWSGLVPPVPHGSTPTSRVLRGEFSGEGVLGFRSMPRGGPGRVRLDGGQWVNLSQRDVWTHHYLRVMGGGPHVVEFDAPSLVADYRNMAELLVDELTLLPVVDFSTALDTPGQVWTPTFTQYGKPAYGAPGEGARGGAVVVLDESHITTPFPQSALLKVRSLGDAQFSYEGSYPGGGMTLSTETTPEGDWKIRAVELNHSPTGDGLLTLYSNTPAMVDYIEVVEKPATLEAAVGMPPGTFRTGGDVPWSVLPVTSVGAYAARPVFTQQGQSGWMEHDVTGPAEILLECYTRDQDFRVLVDGRVTWTGGTNNFRQPVPVRIEVPAGQHVVRYGSAVAGTYPGYYAETWISSMKVNALPTGGVTAAALDFSSPYGTSGTWTVTDAVSQQGGTSLAPAPVPYGINDYPRLVLPLTGPGYFRAANHIATGSYSSSFQFNTSFNQSVQRGLYSTGWAWQPIWIPPGEHYLTITAPESTVKHLDQFSFTPSEYLTVEDLVSGESAPLTYLPANQPWTGIRKQTGEPPVILSPMIGKDAPKKLSMSVSGPGRISFKWKTINRAVGAFLIDGVPSPLTLAYDSTTEESETLFIDSEGPHTLEWEVRFLEYGTLKDGWMEMRDLVWTPVVVSPLAEALDGPAGSTWTTSPEHPFHGYPTPGAVGGTAANVVLRMGEESWLQTTVEGPGIFSFSMVESIARPNGPVTGYPWMLVDIDGKITSGPVYEYGRHRHLILGGGIHTIRLNLSMMATAPNAQVALAVDAVAWTPAAETDAGPEWTSDTPGSLGHYPGMSERDGKDLVALHPLAGGPQWMERSVTGPGLLTWESRKTPGMTTRRNFTLSIDGVPVTNGHDEHGDWNKYELHVPPGTHTVRFSADTAAPAVPSSPENDLPPSWQISGMSYAPGETDLMKGIDSMAMPWLGFDPGYTELVEGSGQGTGDDYFYSNWTAYHVINASAERLLATARNGGHLLPKMASRILPPWSAVAWNPRESPHNISSYDAFRTEIVSTVPLDEALDIPVGTESEGGWTGLAVASAYDRVDAGFSLLEAENATAAFTRSVVGPARVRFRWKLTGEGTLAFSINGQTEPAEATDGWTEVEHYVNAGTHTFGWSHRGSAMSDLIPTAAWVDALVVDAIPQRTLDEAAGGPGFTLEATSPGTDGAWRATFRKSPFGGWEDLAATRSGGAVMTTTITGPAVLIFRSQMTQVADYPQVSPPDGPYRMWDYIQVTVGGVVKANASTWNLMGETAIHIPAGMHEITWQMMSEYMTIEGTTFTAAYTGDHMEAAVDDVSVSTPRAHYEAWVAGSGLADGKSGPRDDADGDGVINFMEYAFRTDANSSVDRPAPPFIHLSPSYLRLNDPTVVVHLFSQSPPLHISARLQQSPDLVTWAPVDPGEPLSTQPVVGGDFVSLEFPIPVDGKPLFFRYEIDLPEED